MISGTDAEKWLAELQVIGAEIQTMNARLKTLLKELERIREKLL